MALTDAIAGSSGMETGPLDGQAPDAVERLRRVQRYFLSLVKTATPWPEDEWGQAWEAYEKTETRDRIVNRWKTKVDTLLAFEDEEPATVHFRPARAYLDDELTVRRCAAFEALYEYLSEELNYREILTRTLHTARVQNIGALVQTWDRRRMLPDTVSLEVSDIRMDPAGKGDLGRAGWLAYRETIAIDKLLMERPDLDREELERAGHEPVDLFSGEPKPQSPEILQAREMTRATHRQVTRWRIFARNEFALYDVEPKQGPEGEPHWERFRDRNGQNEPRRYLELVEGYPVPLEDTDEWPAIFALDWDEWPILFLVQGRGKEPLSPASDYAIQRPIEDVHSQALTDAKHRSFLGGGTKLGGPQGQTLDEATVRKFVESKAVQYLPGAFGPDGRPRIAPVKFDGLDQWQLLWLDALADADEEQSGIPKIRAGGEGEYETATEAQIASDASVARSNVALRAYERFQALFATRIVTMARANLPALSAVEVSPDGVLELKTALNLAQIASTDPLTGLPGPVMPDALPGGLRPEQIEALSETGAEGGLIDKLSQGQVDALLRLDPNAEIVYLGVEALIGPEHAQVWDEQAPEGLIRRQVRVIVERGSTQRRTRLQKVMAFSETWKNFGEPLAQILTALGPVGIDAALMLRAEALKKVLGMQDLEEFESLVPDLEPIRQAIMVQAQAAQAAEPAEAAT